VITGFTASDLLAAIGRISQSGMKFIVFKITPTSDNLLLVLYANTVLYERLPCTITGDEEFLFITDVQRLVNEIKRRKDTPVTIRVYRSDTGLVLNVESGHVNYYQMCLTHAPGLRWKGDRAIIDSGEKERKNAKAGAS
jgi:hypothetical protein